MLKMVEESVEKKSRFSNQSSSIDNIIYEGHLIFENYKKDEEILAVCTKFGYTPEVMAEGLALFDELKAKLAAQKKEHDSKKIFTADVGVDLDLVNETFMRLLNIARIVFKKNVAVRTVLELDEKRRDAFPKRVAQMKRFYDNIVSEDILPELARYSITAESIAVDRATLDNLIAVDTNQEEKKADSKESTSKKDDALGKYLEWMGDFRKLIKIELKGRDILDKLEG